MNHRTLGLLLFFLAFSPSWIVAIPVPSPGISPSKLSKPGYGKLKNEENAQMDHGNGPGTAQLEHNGPQLASAPAPEREQAVSERVSAPALEQEHAMPQLSAPANERKHASPGPRWNPDELRRSRSAKVYVKDGKLFKFGQALPSSKEEVDLNDPHSRWFQRNDQLGKWESFRIAANTEFVHAGPRDTAEFSEREGKLFRFGEPLPSKKKVNLNEKLEPWFEKDQTGVWYEFAPVVKSELHQSMVEDSSEFYMKEGKLFQFGRALPSSKEEVDTKDPESRWFQWNPLGYGYRIRLNKESGEEEKRHIH